jgi:ribosome biogenesis GTPase
MAETNLIPGLILRAQSGLFDVQTDEGVFRCKLRGRLTQSRRKSDVVAAGDRVLLSRLEPGIGVIERVEARQRALSRRAVGGRPDRKSAREQVLLANPDQVLFVFAAAEPDPGLRMLDRLLVAAEREQLPALIAINKIDLTGRAAAAQLFGLYARLEYPVLYVSAKTGNGIDELRRVLARKITAVAGRSGVGKSSLLNAVQPGLALPTLEVSQATGKGRHATVFPELVGLEGGGYVADTPGLRLRPVGYRTERGRRLLPRDSTVGSGLFVQRLHPSPRARLRCDPGGGRGARRSWALRVLPSHSNGEE